MKPIGVFDSGVGGLTVVSALRRRLPEESIVYLGDTARLPYGTKSPATVRRYTQANIAFLLERDVKGIVVACNTASALALGPVGGPGVSARGVGAPVPIWGVIEPGADEAARRSAGRVGVVATESTIRSDAYRQALLARRPELEVVSQACPLFVPLVEEGWYDDPVTVDVARRYLAPLLDAHIDTLVLGCTHYPLLAPVLRQLVGPGIVLVDSAEAVAARVSDDLDRLDLRASGGGVEHHLCVTDAAERFRRLAVDILGSGGGGVDASLELVEVPPHTTIGP